MNPRPASHTLTALFGLALLFSACGGNCPDLFITNEVHRFNPYQLNQNIIFEDANQNLDTLVVTQYDNNIDLVPCSNSNQDFQVEYLRVKLESTTTDSLFFRLGCGNNNFVYVGFGECCNIDTEFDPVADTTHFSYEAQYTSVAQTEVVNGANYTKVITFTPQYPHPKIQAAKVAIDHGLVAYQDPQGTWWFKQ